MDQQELRRLESQCIQEESPECTAACPLHVDARAFVGLVARGDWAGSYKTLSRTMPLPGILGRICDAPCERRCKRAQAGGAIKIGALERACVSRETARDRPRLLPARGQAIAIVGTGLSSLTVAWDSIRKGYRVQLFEPETRPGASLRDRYPDLLPTEVIEKEIALLSDLGVEFELEVAVGEPGFLDGCVAEFGAVYLGLDAVRERSWGLGEDESGMVSVEPRVQRASREGVFAGGRGRGDKRSPVYEAAEGRWAATSIDRFLQGVSLTAGREKEGPYRTRLFTNLRVIQPVAPVRAAEPAQGFNAEEAVSEAGRCLQCQCLECVKVCVYLEKFGSYPRKYAREIYNNESIVMGTRLANRLVNSCSLCGLCERVCPEDFAMQDLCLKARRSMVQRGKMPPSAHEFALLDMDFSLSTRFSLARHEPGLSESTYAFFPGCRLCASLPDKVEAVYGHLRAHVAGGVGLMLGCCGAPAYWAGREDLFSGAVEAAKGEWRGLGEPALILACSTCLRMFREHLPEIPVLSLWQVLEKGAMPVSAAAALSPLAIHDPCTSRTEPDVQSSVRRLLGRLAVPVEELELGRELAECCGFGGLMKNANPGLASRVAATRGERSERDYLTYCAMCRDSFSSAGKRAIHLLDLLFPDPRMTDPAGRENTGWSAGQENRSRLRERLLCEVWLERPPEIEEHRKVRLEMGPDVKALLEKRRILEEDVQRVIHHAEAADAKFLDPVTGRFKASFRPRGVTFWVEYTPQEGAFVIFDVYSHRMEVSVP